MILVSEKIILYLLIKFKNNSNEILDYSIKGLKELNTSIEDNTYICYKNNSIIRVDNQSYIEPKKGEILLCRIRKVKNTNQYIIENPIPTNISEDNSNSLNIKLWYILNYENTDNNNDNNVNQDNNIKNNIDKKIIDIINNDYFLCEKDIIKFGNIKYMIQKININSNKNIINKSKITTINTNKNNINSNNIVNTESSSENSSLDSQENQDNYNINYLNSNNTSQIFNFFPSPKSYYIDETNKNDHIICYICNRNQCNKENPLLKFCICNFFHFECLKKQIKLKEKIIERNNVTNFYLKCLNCKKCHTIYPLKFKISERIYEFYEIEKPADNDDYMIMESLENKMYYGHIKLIHIVKLNENPVKIGRKEIVNDLVICDPSISKEHAIIKYDQENGKILLKNTSKTFGTFVLIKKPLKINEKAIQIQIGKIFIEAKIMKFGEFEKIKNNYTKYPLTKKD